MDHPNRVTAEPSALSLWRYTMPLVYEHFSGLLYPIASAQWPDEYRALANESEEVVAVAALLGETSPQPGKLCFNLTKRQVDTIRIQMFATLNARLESPDVASNPMIPCIILAVSAYELAMLDEPQSTRGDMVYIKKLYAENPSLMAAAAPHVQFHHLWLDRLSAMELNLDPIEAAARCGWCNPASPLVSALLPNQISGGKRQWRRAMTAFGCHPANKMFSILEDLLAHVSSTLDAEAEVLTDCYDILGIMSRKLDGLNPQNYTSPLLLGEMRIRPELRPLLISYEVLRHAARFVIALLWHAVQNLSSSSGVCHDILDELHDHDLDVLASHSPGIMLFVMVLTGPHAVEHQFSISVERAALAAIQLNCGESWDAARGWIEKNAFYYDRLMGSLSPSFWDHVTLAIARIQSEVQSETQQQEPQ